MRLWALDAEELGRFEGKGRFGSLAGFAGGDSGSLGGIGSLRIALCITQNVSELSRIAKSSFAIYAEALRNIEW